jgi:hypothetical protein
MPIKTRFQPAPSARPPRRAAPRCRGGVSSLLRLAQPGSRLPSTLDLGGWIDRATQALKLPAAPAFAPSEFVG